MYITNITDYDNITSGNYTDNDNMTLTNCTSSEKEDLNIIFKYLLPSIPGSVLLFSLISLMICTLIKPLFKNK